MFLRYGKSELDGSASRGTRSNDQPSAELGGAFPHRAQTDAGIRGSSDAVTIVLHAEDDVSRLALETEAAGPSSGVPDDVRQCLARHAVERGLYSSR